MHESLDWVRGDASGLAIPAHIDALLDAGPDWLTRAFRAFGAIAEHNSVTAITRVEPCGGGSTGKKFFIGLEFAEAAPGLDDTLFLKFSRDFDDERRDRQRTEMEGEARFVALSREPDFPLRVPRGWFADYAADSGTGVVITERIRYGEHGIEPHRRKCLDHETLSDPLPYYGATVSALARLAAAHRSGRLPTDIETRFPWNPLTASADPIRYSADSLDREIDRCVAFSEDCPRLLPAEIRSPAFLDSVRRDAHRIREHEDELRNFLTSDPRMISLNHWNSHIDNCWFWRDGDALHCGLIDWGRVGQITFGAALWGGLSAAHHDIWNHHLDALLARFTAEYRAHGGPALTLAELKRHLCLHMATMGVARVLALPEIVRFRLPGCVDASGPLDPVFRDIDPARNCLWLYTVLMQSWQREDFGRLLDELLG